MYGKRRFGRSKTRNGEKRGDNRKRDRKEKIRRGEGERDRLKGRGEDGTGEINDDQGETFNVHKLNQKNRSKKRNKEKKQKKEKKKKE